MTPIPRVFRAVHNRHLLVCLHQPIQPCYASQSYHNPHVKPRNASPRRTSTLIITPSPPPPFPTCSDLTKVLKNSEDASYSPPLPTTTSTTAIVRTSDLRLHHKESNESLLSIWAALSKARLTGLVVSTALGGCTLAAAAPALVSTHFLLHPAASLLSLGVGTTLTSAAANCINQIMEVQYDAMMKRTQMRPLVRKTISPEGASVFAGVSASLGLAILYTGTNDLVASLAGANILLYTCVYTPLKRLTPLNTAVGAVVGAIPPLMGWAAATGCLSYGSLALAGLLYTWQFPHFIGLSWLAREDYARAGYVMPVNLDPHRAQLTALKSSILAAAVCFIDTGGAGEAWVNVWSGLLAAPFNALVVYRAFRFYRTPVGDVGAMRTAARAMFRVSLLQLPLVMCVLLMVAYWGEVVA